MKYESEKEQLLNINIDGYNVAFPFEPYDCQKDIIKTILIGLKNKTHSIIESPTGTGKCLSALSAVFAFLKKNHKDISFIEEKQKIQSIIKIFMCLEEMNPHLEKLVKNYKNSYKKNSVNKVLQEMKIIIECESDYNQNSINLKELDLNSFFLKTEMMIQYKDKIYIIIAKKILEIFHNFSSNIKSVEEIEIKLNDFLELLDISQNKLKDQLKLMKHSHTIIYTVRTSSQIDIVYEEFEKIKEPNNIFNFAYLKSRNFFCINEELEDLKGTSKIRKCKKKCKKQNGCDYYVKFKKDNTVKFNFDPELNNYRNDQLCPYFNEIKNAKFADVIVCTYNYLLNKNSRNDILSYAINPIIIIDEAHNIVNACEDFLNFKISIIELIGILESIFNLYDKIKKSEKNISESAKIKNNKIIQMMKPVIAFLLVLVNSIILLNQNFDHEIKKFDFSNTFIFDVFSMLLSLEKFKGGYDKNKFYLNQLKENNNEYNNYDYINLNELKNSDYFKSENSNENSNKIKTEDLKIILLNFLNTIINRQNFTKFLIDFQGINDKHIDLLNGEIKNLDKLNNIFYLIFETLINNFERTFLNSPNKNNLNKKAYVEDYYLTINIAEIDYKKENELEVIEELKVYKDFLFQDDNFYDIIKNIMDQSGFQNDPDKNIQNLKQNEINKYSSSDNLIKDTSLDILKKIYKKLKIFLQNKSQGKFDEKYINLICMNPAICFQNMKRDLNPSSIILLSGTLNPFDYYSDQLGIKFENKLENNHIVNKSNINFFIFDSSVINPGPIEISFTQSNSEKYAEELYIETIKIINDFSQNSGKGNLIFLKTYSMLNEFQKFLIKIYQENKFVIKKYNHYIDVNYEKNKIYRRFYFDSNAIDSSVKNTIMTNYKKSCSEGTKTFLISVMRGLFSEGVNFDNEESSMIYVLGIPYPDITGDFIRLKKDYITTKYRKNESSFNGDEWYQIQAMTAFNQALGRSIRRKNDFSTICVMEKLIHNIKIFKLMSKWLRRSHLNIVTRYDFELHKENNKKFYHNFLTNKNKDEEILFNFKSENNNIITSNVFLDRSKGNTSSIKINPVGNNTGFVTFSFK